MERWWKGIRGIWRCWEEGRGRSGGGGKDEVVEGCGRRRRVGGKYMIAIILYKHV